MNPQSQNKDFKEQISTQAPQARPEHHSLWVRILSSTKKPQASHG
jgi:hypothetical protein